MSLPITNKTISKWNKELLELHKRVLKTEVTAMEIRYTVKAKIFKLYNYCINEKNIQEYFHTPIWLLIKGMVQGNLEKYRTITFKNKSTKPKRKKRK